MSATRTDTAPKFHWTSDGCDECLHVEHDGRTYKHMAMVCRNELTVVANGHRYGIAASLEEGKQLAEDLMQDVVW